MRYEGCLLTLDESNALIEEMNAWCRRTGTNYNKLVGLARVSATMRSSVRTRGKRVTMDVAARLKAAMKANPQGIKETNYHGRNCAIMAAPIRQAAAEIELRRVNREPCFYCGVRADVGCEHSLSASARSVRIMR